MRFSFIVLLHIIIVVKTISGLRERRMILDRLDICFVAEDAPLIIHSFGVDYLPDNHYASSVCGEVLHDLNSNDISVYIDVTRCANKEALDTCEYYTKINPPMHICNFLKLKELGIYDMMKQFKPPCFCPFKKGNYTAEHVGYKLKDFTLFPIGNYFWKVKFHALLKRKIFASVCLEAQSVDRPT